MHYFITASGNVWHGGESTVEGTSCVFFCTDSPEVAFGFRARLLKFPGVLMSSTVTNSCAIGFSSVSIVAPSACGASDALSHFAAGSDVCVPPVEN